MEIKNGAKIFIKNDTLNKFLFVLRDNKPDIPNPNMWGLFGGGIDSDETPINTIKRELAEEINISIFDIKEICSKKLTHNVQGEIYNIIGYYFIGKTSTVDLSKTILNEGQKVAFFSLEEISQMENVSPSIKKLIRVYKNILV